MHQSTGRLWGRKMTIIESCKVLITVSQILGESEGMLLLKTLGPVPKVMTFIRLVVPSCKLVAKAVRVSCLFVFST